MASTTGIINSAIRKLGASRITGRDDGSRNANIADDIYDDVLEKTLRSANWKFAKTLAKLARSSVDPAFGFDYTYEQPSDYVRTVAVYNNDAGVGIARYKLHGDGFHSNDEEIYLEYIRLETDPNKMTADFRECLAYDLAKEMSTPIKAGKAIRDRLTKDYEDIRAIAKSQDSIEDLPEQVSEGQWIEDRSR
jgi:hypothetical protein